MQKLGERNTYTPVEDSRIGLRELAGTWVKVNPVEKPEEVK